MEQKIAVIVQRYGLEINGGAEYHARLITEQLSGRYRMEVFTSSALDYITWAPHFAAGTEEIHGIPVHRFHVLQPRDPERFGEVQKKVFFGEHALADEATWLEAEGPLVPNLLDALARRSDEFSLFLFFSYRYYHSFHGVQRFAKKAVLIPTAEQDDVIHLKIFSPVFRLPAAIVYNSVEEREMIWRISANQEVMGDIVGVGSEIPERFDPQATRHRLGIPSPYILYIGRLDENKGVPLLFHHFTRFFAETKKAVHLVLVGRSLIPIPRHSFIHHAGFLSDQEKFDLLKGAELLVVPSQYESLSMACLEAWALSRPVLVNGRTPVLKGQCRRSQGGLWFTSYDEFRESLLLLLENGELRESMARAGRAYFEAHYSWPVITDKYTRLFARIGAGGGATRAGNS